jgi:formylglycine-generating enzyme required for sulfatase activity
MLRCGTTSSANRIAGYDMLGKRTGKGVGRARAVKLTEAKADFSQMRLLSIGLSAVLFASSLTAQSPPRVSTRVNPIDGLTYVWIPPGTFTMGCSPGDRECSDDEKPAHRVTITKGFWIGRTEVTQAAYEHVTGRNPSEFKGASLPVETISWDEAGAYCKAVGMRLPTEAEWEYAARGRNPAARYGALDAVAWVPSNSGAKTHDVAQKQPNGYGLYDMLGNIWEWVADWFDYKYYASRPASDPKGPSSAQNRTVRGGARDDIPRNAPASARYLYAPDSRSNDVGVRCAGD